MIFFWLKLLTVGAWLAATVLFLLSLWIVLPPPNFFWLQFAVVVPEISPLLTFLSGTFLFIIFVLSYSHFLRFPFILVILLTATCVLSSLPLLQLPETIRRAEASMAAAFEPQRKPGNGKLGNNQLENGKLHQSTPAIASTLLGLFNEQRDVVAKVRHQAKIPFPVSSPGPFPGPSPFPSQATSTNPLTEPETEPKTEEAQLALDLYQPPTAGRYPALVILYGGGWSRGDSSENEAFARYFAARGYVVVAIAYRLTPEYRFPVQAEDVNAALAFVRDRTDEYEIARDSNGQPQLSLVGWSAGAHLAMLEGFQSAEGIQSIVNFYGPVDLANGYANPPVPDPLDVQEVLKAFIGGTPTEFPEAYAQASPITYVNAAQPNSLPPVLLVYGGRDHIVEAKYGKVLYQQLLASKNTAVWLHIPWAEHAFDKVFRGISNRVALHFVEQFLDQTLR